MNKLGKVIVIVAPSGTGKSTLIKKLLKEFPVIKWSVSCTTRPIRDGEENGKDYWFLSKAEFEARIKQNDFIEWAKVHSNYYGTSKTFLAGEREKGFYVLCDLDVQGTDSLKKEFKDEAIAIFIEPPSIEELENRLRLRATDKEEVIVERIKNARSELLRKNDFDYLVLNDDIDSAYKKLKTIFTTITKES